LEFGLCATEPESQARLNALKRTYAAGKMGMDDVGRYRKHAANCLSIAQHTADPKAKLALIDMAQIWVALAEEAERNGGLVLDPLTQKPLAKPANPSLT
jgi:hypothetical protein